MKHKKTTYHSIESGLSIVEIILAVMIFSILAVSGVATVVHSFTVNRRGEEETQATVVAQEGIEAARSIKNKSWSALTSGLHGLSPSGNQWSFSGTSDINGKFTRVVNVEAVNRDGSGNIVPAPTGSADSDTMKVTSTATWDFYPGRSESVSLVSYMSNFRKTIITTRGGVLVYGDGGTTTDAMKYRVLDGSAGTWGSVQTFPDFDTSASNKALRAIRVYASKTRNEKIALTRHFNGTQESIYAHVYNGTTWSSAQMISWTGSAFDTSNQGIRNFDGQYLNNGNFLLVYSDNTNIPKYRIWNGSSWSPNPPTAGTSVADVGGIPNNITLRNRDGSNEAMLTVFDQSSDTNTVYYNGSAWSAVTEHATAAPTNTKEFAEFAWSADNPLQGALVFQTASNDRAMNIKLWTANGSGGGVWTGNNVNTANQGTLGAMELDGGRKGAEEFLACDKDASNDIYCFRGNTTPTWASPTNNIMTATTDTGIQRSFDLAYDGSTGSEAIVVYSDTTSVPKLKKYTASTNTFDASPTSLSTLGGALKTVKLRSFSESDDIMIMMGDANNDFYTVVWNGSSNVVYTTPTGKAFTTHGTNGSNAIELWYGFAWDRF